MTLEPREDEIGTIWQGEDAVLAAEAAQAVHEARIKKLLAPLNYALKQKYREYVPDISRENTNVPHIEAQEDGAPVVLNAKDTEAVIEGIELLQKPNRFIMEDISLRKKSQAAKLLGLVFREKRNLRNAMDAKLADASQAFSQLDAVKAIARNALEKSKALANKKDIN